jgi:hypothetical protein
MKLVYIKSRVKMKQSYIHTYFQYVSTIQIFPFETNTTLQQMLVNDQLSKKGEKGHVSLWDWTYKLLRLYEAEGLVSQKSGLGTKSGKKWRQEIQPDRFKYIRCKIRLQTNEEPHSVTKPRLFTDLKLKPQSNHIHFMPH